MRLGVLQTLIRKLSVLAVGLSLVLSWGASPAWAGGGKLAKHMPGQLIVGFKKGTSPAMRSEILQKFNATPLDTLDLINADVIQVPQNRSLESWMKVFKSHPRVKFAEPNYELHLTDYTLYKSTPPHDRDTRPSQNSTSSASGTATTATTTPTLYNDPYMSSLWGLHNTGQTGGKTGADARVATAWTSYQIKRTVIVAVIDTGVDYTHGDLKSNVWTNALECKDPSCDPTRWTNKNRKDEDKNSYLDDTLGWNFVNNNNNPMDDNNHGTHCAGTIAAVSNNRLGVTGVAGQGSVKIMALKFLDRNGSGYLSNAVKAIQYATQKRAHIISASWGGSSGMQSLQDAITAYKASGGLFVVAAGNNGRDIGASPIYPARYTVSNMIKVAALDHNDALASFSNYSAVYVDLGAPGVNILSTLRNQAYGRMSGTSMATPHVAGAAGLVMSMFPTLNGEGARTVILQSVRPLSSLSGFVVTGGALNAESALTKAGSPSP